MGVLVVAVIAIGLQNAVPLTNLYIMKATVIFASGAGIVLWSSARFLRSSHFGAANRITMARVAMTALVFALIGEPVSAATSAGSNCF